MLIEKLYDLGIIGGMGPEATNLLFGKIISSTLAYNDFEHIPIIIFNETRIIHSHTNYKSEIDLKPHLELENLVNHVERVGVRNVSIACNSLHFYSQIFSNRSFYFINMINETIVYINQLGFKGLIFVLGSSVTTNLNLYQKESQIINNLNILNPIGPIQSQIDKLIDSLKSTKTRDIEYSYLMMKSIISKLGKESLFIIACTELSLLSRYLLRDRYNIIDALDILAVKSILKSGYKLNEFYVSKELTCNLSLLY